MHIKKLISILFSILLIISLCPLGLFELIASAETTSGMCGESLTWEYDSDSTTLTISGTGAMNNYAFSDAPWHSYYKSMKMVVIENDVTSIGSYAFYGCTGLKSITIGNGVTSIGKNAFYNCTRLESITVESSNPVYHSAGNCLIETESKTLIAGCNNSIIPNDGSVTSISECAFYGRSGLTIITIPDSVTSIGASAFYETTWYNKQPNGLVYAGKVAYKYKGTCPSSVVIKDGTLGIADGAFYNCTGLRSITIPNGVISIGNKAFEGCSVLTGITIPNGVISIGNFAFWGCSGLKVINIQNSLTAIGSHAFEDCTGLTNITMPDSVTSIGNYAFSGCTGLKSITIGNGVTSIGKNAFYDCTRLTKVNYRGNISGWCKISFYYAYSNPLYYAHNLYINNELVVDLIIPDSVTSIGDYAFYGCTGLKSVTIGNGVTSIGNCAFYNCTGLTSVTIPDSVAFIGDEAFYGCKGLESIPVSSNTTTIRDSAFRGFTNLRSIDIPDSVTSIEDYAFYGCTGLESITIPDSVTSIGNYAFYGCTGLKSVTIGNGVTSIGNYTFYNCTGLESVTVKRDNPVYHSAGNCLIETESKTLIAGCNNSIIPNDGSVTSIEDSAFYGCAGLESITIPDSVTSIGNYAFYGCTGLKSVTIGNGVTSIGKNAFYDCTRLTSVTIPDSVTSIGNGAFFNCTELTSVIIPDSVTSIGYSTFSGCSSLSEITLPFVGNKRYTLSDAYQYPFGYIFGKASYSGGTATNQKYYDSSASDAVYSTYYIPSKLKTVTISGCEHIQYGAFYGCRGLTNVTILDSVTSIGDYAFYECIGLESITIPDSVTSIGASAFCECQRLKSITIPDSVTSIGDKAFSACSALESITVESSNPVYHSAGNCLIETESKTLIAGCNNSIIPNDGSVTSISAYAFKCCTGLTSITIPNSVITIGGFAFYSCTGLTNVTIPDSVTSISAYAFHRCTGLTSITIPNSVITIGDFAFYSCTGLANVTIPNSVTSIGDYAFEYCNNLEQVYYCGNANQRNEISMGNYNDSLKNAVWHYECNGQKENYYYYLDSNSNIRISEIVDCPKNVVIPGFIDGHPVTAIGDNILSNFTDLKSITIPNGVTSIGTSAIPQSTSIICYEGSESEKYAKINGNAYALIMECGENAYGYVLNNTLFIAGFGDMDNYKTQAVVPWYNYADNITEIIIDEGITKIGAYAFYCFNNLENVIVKNKDTDFGKYAFNTGNGNIMIFAENDGNVQNYCNKNGMNYIDPKPMPILVSVSANSVTIDTIDGYEYSINLTDWQISGIFTGLSPVTEYILYARHIAVAEYFTDTLYKTLTVKTDKGIVPAPSAPVCIMNTDTLIILQANSLYEFSIDGVNWQKSNGFSGLIHGNIYSIYQRVAETATEYASAPSEPLVMQLVKKTVSAPIAPDYRNHTYNSVTLVPNALYEFSIDGVNWQKSNVFTGLSKNAIYRFYQRIAETQTEYASPASAPLIIAIPDKPKILEAGYENILLKKIDGFEYCIDDMVWQESNSFDMLIDNTEYYVYQRLKAVDGEKIYQITSDYIAVITDNSITRTNIPGDINDDGKVNNKDLTRLFQYLSDWDVTVNEAALDVNGDGKVNNKDLTRLFQYLSDWDVEIF